MPSAEHVVACPLSTHPVSAAVPALLGSSLVVVAHESHHYSVPVLWCCVVIVFVLRIVAVILDLNAPQPLRTGDRP